MEQKLIETALGQLGHQDRIVRKNAAQILAQYAPDNATARIQKALSFESEITVKKWLALALARIGDPNTIETVKQALYSAPEHEAKDWLLLAHSILNKEGRLNHIKDLLRSKSHEDLKKAAQLLWASENVPISEMRSLMRLAEHEDPDVRRWSVLAMGKGGLDSPDAFRPSLKDPNYLVREWTECSLSQLKEKTPHTLLVPGLDDTHPRVREWAIKALATTKNDEVPEILIFHLKNEVDLECREAIYRSLASYNTTTQDISTILQSASKIEVNPSVLMAAIDLLVASPLARKDIFLLEAFGKVCYEVEKDLLSPYFVNRLFETATPEDQNALQLVVNSPSNEFIYSEMVKTTVQKANKNKNNNLSLGVLIALKEEFRIFSELVEELNPLENSGFYKFRIDRENLKFSGICKLIGAKGETRALLATRELVDLYNPNLIANIGIAASIDSDLLLADVIIGTQVTNYMHDSKAIEHEKGWGYLLSGDPFPTNPSILAQAINFEFQYPELYKDWKNRSSLLYGEVLDPKLLQKLFSLKVLRNVPELIEGKIASGPTVGASTSFVNWLKKKGDRTHKALEMESGGVVAASSLSKVQIPTIIIRGISDFADERKNELENDTEGGIRKIAMVNASNFLITLMSKIQIS